MILTLHPTNSNTPLPLTLELMGLDHRQEPIMRPNGMPLFQWFYCVQGQGEVIVDNRRSVISQGQGLLIYPDVPHVYRAITPDWTVHFLGFQGLLCNEILKTLQMHETGVYYFSDSEVFVRHMSELYHLYQTAPLKSVREFSKACYDFLIDLSPCITRIYPAAEAEESERIAKVISYIEQYYDRDLPLDVLALEAGLSKEYLCTLFKKSMQQTLSHFILSIRISRARSLLIRFPNMKIAEIAKQCGFASPSYFGKQFKHQMGMTPEQFRRIRS